MGARCECGSENFFSRAVFCCVLLCQRRLTPSDHVVKVPVLWEKVRGGVSGDWCDWAWTFYCWTLCCAQHGFRVEFCSDSDTHFISVWTQCACGYTVLSFSVWSRTCHAVTTRSHGVSVRASGFSVCSCWSQGTDGTVTLPSHPFSSCLLCSCYSASVLAGSVWCTTARKPVRRLSQPAHQSVHPERQCSSPSLCPATSVQSICLNPHTTHTPTTNEGEWMTLVIGSGCV